MTAVSNEPFPVAVPSSLQLPPSSSFWCCSFGWRSVMMLMLEGGSIAGGVGSILSTNKVALGLFAGMLIVSGIVHGLWLRDAAVADLHRVASQLQKTADQTTTNRIQWGLTERLLGNQVKEFSEQLDRLSQDATLLVQVQELTGLSIVELKAMLEEMHRENTTLTTNATNLQNKVDQLTHIMTQFKKQLEARNQQNAALGVGVQQLGNAVGNLHTTQAGFGELLAGFDKEFDTDVIQLAQEVTRAQQASNAMVEALSKQLKEFLKSVQYFDKQTDDLDADAARMTTAVEKLDLVKQDFERLQKRNKELEGLLTHTTEEVHALTAALTSRQGEVAAQAAGAQHLDEVLTRLQALIPQLTEQRQFGAEVAARQAALEKQKQQLQNLE